MGKKKNKTETNARDKDEFAVEKDELAIANVEKNLQMVLEGFAIIDKIVGLPTGNNNGAIKSKINKKSIAINTKSINNKPINAIFKKTFATNKLNKKVNNMVGWVGEKGADINNISNNDGDNGGQNNDKFN